MNNRNKFKKGDYCTYTNPDGRIHLALLVKPTSYNSTIWLCDYCKVLKTPGGSEEFIWSLGEFIRDKIYKKESEITKINYNMIEVLYG